MLLRWRFGSVSCIVSCCAISINYQALPLSCNRLHHLSLRLCTRLRQFNSNAFFMHVIVCKSGCLWHFLEFLVPVVREWHCFVHQILCVTAETLVVPAGIKHALLIILLHARSRQVGRNTHVLVPWPHHWIVRALRIHHHGNIPSSHKSIGHIGRALVRVHGTLLGKHSMVLNR